MQSASLGQPFASRRPASCRARCTSDEGKNQTRPRLDIELEVVDTGRKCLARLEEAQHDVLLLDYRLPDMDGIDVLKELAAKEVSLPVVMVTAVGDDALVVQVLRLGARDYVPKQGNYLQSLPAILKNAVIEHRRTQEQGPLAGRPRQRRKRITPK